MGPAAGAKIVTTVVLGAVGAGVFAGVSHDGRGAEPVESESVVVPPSNTTAAGTAPPSTAPTITTTTATSSTVAAQPATPDSAPPRARVRSGGS